MRPIKTEFYNHKNHVLHTNSALDANKAVANAIMHMQVNHYGARACQVFDSVTSEVHAEIKRDVKGNITITYRRDPRNHETKIRLDILLADVAPVKHR